MFNVDVDTKRLSLVFACPFLFWLAWLPSTTVLRLTYIPYLAFISGIAKLFQSEGVYAYFHVKSEN